MKINLKNNERLDDLQFNNLFIITLGSSSALIKICFIGASSAFKTIFVIFSSAVGTV